MTYTLYYKSDEHPRTINTPRNARTNFSTITCTTEREVIFNYYKLCIQGKKPFRISGQRLGDWPYSYWVLKDENNDPYIERIPSRGLALCR